MDRCRKYNEAPGLKIRLCILARDPWATGGSWDNSSDNWIKKVWPTNTELSVQQTTNYQPQEKWL
jgi:hypothetical protein